MHPALLARRQTHLGLAALFRHQLRASTSAAHHLAAATFRQLNVVNNGTSRDVLQRQGIARLDIRFGTSRNTIAHLKAQRRENIALLTIQIMQQGDTRRAVRIVLDRRNLRRNTQLVALEIDQTIGTFGATATMANRNFTLVVTPGVLHQFHSQRFLWSCLGNLLESRDRHATAARRCWSILSNWHLLYLSLMPSMRRLTHPRRA